MLVVALVALTAIALAHGAAASRADSTKEQEKKGSHSRLGHHFDWIKVRLDEMDATLAQWESKAAELQGDVRAKAESALTEMRARRDAFRETLKKEAEMSEAEWNRAKAAREADWKAFEASARKYIDETGAQIEQQEAAFRARADAQRKAWQEAIDKLDDAAAKRAAEAKGKAESAVKQMKADAEAAEAKLDKLRSGGAESWSAFEKALAETRAAFDRANQTAHDAFGKSGPAGTRSEGNGEAPAEKDRR
jgi:ElaB/YqjD/DUF883 family membrane-anchored ribosome-binding protein